MARRGALAGDSSVAAGFLGHPLQLAAVPGPPPLVHRRQVVAPLQQSRCPVDDLPNSVGVTGVPLGVHDDMDQDLVQGYLVLTGGPVRDMSDAVLSLAAESARCLVRDGALGAHRRGAPLEGGQAPRRPRRGPIFGNPIVALAIDLRPIVLNVLDRGVYVDVTRALGHENAGKPSMSGLEYASAIAERFMCE